MFFGDTAVGIDQETMHFILRQKENMPEGKAWGDDFPEVINHTSSTMARKHHDFDAAKHGDMKAALRLVDDLVKEEKLLEIATRFPSAHIVYNHRIQGTNFNLIPAAYAQKFAALGMTVEHGIIAVTNVSHTNASDITRLSKRMRFEGPVSAGTDYILLDDFITSGAELRDMRDYIESNGGKVVLITTFGHGSFGKLKDIRIDEEYKQRFKQLGITDQDLRKYGIASQIDCLTLSEAARLTRMISARAKTESSQVCNQLQLLFPTEQSLPEMEELIRQSQSNETSVSVQSEVAVRQGRKGR